MGHLLGIDVGGTFTDFVAYDNDTQRLEVWKTLSTPHDPGEGIVGGLEKGTAQAIGGLFRQPLA
ncbi:MAG: hydantoinase/oxoprolinase N-terminal domain-containing protein [Alphaproteobacteria bacterium]